MGQHRRIWNYSFACLDEQDNIYISGDGDFGSNELVFHSQNNTSDTLFQASAFLASYDSSGNLRWKLKLRETLGLVWGRDQKLYGKSRPFSYTNNNPYRLIPSTDGAGILADLRMGRHVIVQYDSLGVLSWITTDHGARFDPDENINVSNGGAGIWIADVNESGYMFMVGRVRGSGLYVNDTIQTKNFDSFIGVTRFPECQAVQVIMDSLNVLYCAGDSFGLPLQFGFKEEIDSNSVFSIVLSDEFGDFSNPQVLGTLSHATNPDTIWGIWPFGLNQLGDEYHIQIRESGGQPSYGHIPYYVYINPEPGDGVLLDTASCAGVPLEITNLNAFDYILWQPASAVDDSMGFIVTAMVDTSYTLFAHREHVCGLATDTFQISAVTIDVPEIVGDSIFCEGDSLNLSANVFGGNLFEWEPAALFLNPNDLTVSISPDSSQYISFSASDSVAGCAETDSVWIQVLETPAQPVVIFDSLTNALSISNANSTLQYQWYLNGGLIAGATDTLYMPNQSGQYQVVATKGNCESDLSNEYGFFLTDLEDEFETVGLQVFPSPADQWIKVWSAEPGIAFGQFQLLDMLGKVLIRGDIRLSGANQVLQIDVSAIPAGMYFFSVELASGDMVTQKVKIIH